MEEEAVDEIPDKLVYRAPALEKGLDIIEHLSRQDGPQTFPAIVQGLGRSPGELFRMMQVLEKRGIVEQGSEGFSLTPRLFEIGLGRPPVRNLVETALPVMRQLALRVRQSCHLVLRSRGEMVVVARMESPEQLGFSVRIGYRQPLYLTGSGSVLYAFQPEEVRRSWEAHFDPSLSATQLADLRERATAFAKIGFAMQPSSIFEGITDIATPIMRGDRAAAALAIPFLRPKTEWLALEAISNALLDAAAAISNSIINGDNRA